ncbi:glycoside hydrolase [Hymenopellis radicata]|nr:glycoside hydrolase [Hymenopellis radicata]
MIRLTLLLTCVSLVFATASTWGPYRPNLYFGLRPQIPQSLMTGLIWYGAHDFQSVSRARHACSQDDGLATYTWTFYDPSSGGSQVLSDPFNNVHLTTSFLLTPTGWAARVQGEPIDETRPSRPALIWYLGLEGLGALDMDSDEEAEYGWDGDEEVKFSGESAGLGAFTVRIVEDPHSTRLTPGPRAGDFKHRIGKTTFLGSPVPPGNIWQAKDVIVQRLLKNAQELLAPFGKEGPFPEPAAILGLPNDVYTGSNLYAVQKIFDGPFSFDIFYEEGNDKKMTSSELDVGLARVKETYDAPITANLMGGVGYFHGQSIIDRSFSFEWDEDEDDASSSESGPELTDPMTLLTATPSRSFFPRGFYWDEGFHLLHIGPWDDAFAMKILQSWIGLIDSDGWVAREQILGEEARSKVPPEFQVQVPKYANPPTLVMAITAYIKRVRAHENSGEVDMGELGMGDTQVLLGGKQEVSSALQHESALASLRSLYAPLKRHYDWFRRTQRGLIKPYGRKARSRTEAYRWRGRNLQHVLTSGMDDYPRSPPHAGELHLDLISWMAYFTRTMGEISNFLGETDDAESFATIYDAIKGNIDDLHWDDESGMYCDASVDDEDESIHVCHKGYLSLFPFLLELVDVDSPRLGKILDLVRDEEELWSDYGLRSLSKSHPEFGKGENYWKGPVWVQMNYLALKALHNTYAASPGPYQVRAREIYVELRKNIVDNVFKEYQRTGYVWEQYDALTGEGRRSHPFTGWTSLVTLILSEKY